MEHNKQSQTRQKIGMYYQSLSRTLQWLQKRAPLLPGSVYVRRRRCGKVRCRCVRGHLHQDKVLAIRRGGRIQTQSLMPGDGTRELEAVQAWRRFQGSRRELLQTWSRLMREVDRLGQLRQVHLG